MPIRCDGSNTKSPTKKNWRPEIPSNIPVLNCSASLRRNRRKSLEIGTRVAVSNDKEGRTGVLRFLGRTHFAPGEWAGIELPVGGGFGQHDGTVDGITYFSCSKTGNHHINRGIFIHASRILPVSGCPLSSPVTKTEHPFPGQIPAKTEHPYAGLSEQDPGVQGLPRKSFSNVSLKDSKFSSSSRSSFEDSSLGILSPSDMKDLSFQSLKDLTEEDETTTTSESTTTYPITENSEIRNFHLDSEKLREIERITSSSPPPTSILLPFR